MQIIEFIGKHDLSQTQQTGYFRALHEFDTKRCQTESCYRFGTFMLNEDAGLSLFALL